MTLMWTLYHYPLCPFSRKVRLVLAEKGVPCDLVLTYPWDSPQDLMARNPAGMTPVLVQGDDQLVLADSGAIIEYLEETIEERPLTGSGPADRAEARRLVAWFDQKLYAESSVVLLQEKMWHRLFAPQAPNTTLLRDGLKALDEHLGYIDGLYERSEWLAGSTLSVADLAAAAHLSVLDYLGCIAWDRHESAKLWYMKLKSRPAFRPLLSERMAGLAPPAHYSLLDF
jgi:glutathione S-transferase